MEPQLLTAPPAATPTDPAALLAAIVGLLNGPHAHTLKTFGVGLGQGGAILLNCHYAAYTGQSSYYDIALGHLEEVLGQLSPLTYKSDSGTNYYQELAELGHLVEYLTRKGHLDWDSAPLLAYIDGVLEQRLASTLAQQNFELVNGALSVGTYYLRRLRESATARRGLDTLLAALQTHRGGTEQTGYFWTCRVIVEPRVYTGLSHGSAMVINFLTSLYEADYRAAECAELLHGAIKFLLRTRLDPDQFLSSFPLWQGRNELTNNLCLVYGDLGPAHALARAGRALGHLGYLAEAGAIARRTTRRTSLVDTYLNDASVFYGAAGAYLLYHSLDRLTGEADLAAAAEFWLAQIPLRATHANEYLNFSSFFFEHAPAQLGFNLGLTGIGLTLIQALSDGAYALDEFTWLS